MFMIGFMILMLFLRFFRFFVLCVVLSRFELVEYVFLVDILYVKLVWFMNLDILVWLLSLLMNVWLSYGL